MTENYLLTDEDAEECLLNRSLTWGKLGLKTDLSHK